MYTIDEEDDVELEEEDGLIDAEYREDELNIGDNAQFLDDDINEDMLENDIDDYDDTVNPFKNIS